MVWVMNHLATLVAASVLLTPVPEPAPLPEDPDEAIQQTEKETVAIEKKAADAVRKKRKRLVDHLKALQEKLNKDGLTEQAAAIRDRLTLLEATWSGAVTDKGITFHSLKSASLNGKYRYLLRVLYVPNDKNLFKEFNDFGTDNCITYAGYKDLPPGFWVYVHPYWYVWRDRMRP
jgi:hypothetical protein